MKNTLLESATQIGRWAAPAGVAAAILIGASVAHADGRLTDTDSSVVKTATGDCVNAVGGDQAPMEACGEAMPQPPEAVSTIEVVAAETAATATATDMEKISIAASMLFDFDSAALSDDAKAVIDERIQTFAGQVELTSIMRVEGHTDSIGPEDYNMQLSQRRAQAVADYIVSQAYRVTSSDIAVVGQGESNPVASNDTREGRAKNRRVDIFAQGKMQP
jgi:OOP family OmpA-OmpF porin